MRHTRILIVDLPSILGDILRTTVAAQADMELVTHSDSGTNDVADQLEDIDVVVTGSDDPVAASRILLAHPRGRVLAVLGEGREALLYDLRPHRTVLGEVSPGQLVNVIRGRHRSPPAHNEKMR